MTPEQLQQFENMQKRITDLEEVRNLDAFETLVRRFGEKSKFLISNNTSTTVDTDIDRTVGISTTPTSIAVLDYPDAMMQIVLKGVTYRIPLYDESRF